MKHLLTILTIIFFLISCKNDEKEAILLADREAPLGWVYLRIFADSTFEFESRGLRDKDIYHGKAKITNDSIFFHFYKATPKAGNKAVYNKDIIAFTNGSYPEKLGIKLFKLEK